MVDATNILDGAATDVQARMPSIQVSLTRVGVIGVEKVIRVGSDPDRAAGHYFAELECFVDLNPRQAGVHMSRFEEIINEAIDEAVSATTLRAEELAAKIAERVRERQRGLRAEVRVEARYPETMLAPESGIASQEIYKLHGVAVASGEGTRTLTGVEAQGMTACPCAQELLAARARARLADEDFDLEQIEAIMRSVPVATHNQRGIGSLHVGRPEGVDTPVDVRDLLRIVESSMSSEIYELMKRADEAAVVERAHMHPRFVEDVVREMVRRVAEDYPWLADGGFLLARQENLETIHRHSVVAERSGEFSEILTELESGEHSTRHTSQREWLER